MKKLSNTFIKYFVISLFLLMNINSIAQIDLFTKNDIAVVKEDSIEINKVIELSQLNKEIEYTDNLITKFDISSSQVNRNRDLIKHSDTVNKYIQKQGQEFFEFDMEHLSHYFLVNANYTWMRYYHELRNFQDNIQSQIRSIQTSQNVFVNNVSKWEKNLPNLNKSISNHIRYRVQNNINTSKKIIKEYDKELKSLIEIENDIINDIVYVERILSTIEHYTKLKRAKIFTKTDPSIFSLDYKDSFSGSIRGRIKLAYYENTKTFGYFFRKIEENFYAYALFIILLSVSLFILRRKYLKLGYDESNVGYKSIYRIFISKFYYIILAFAILSWTIIIPFTPLFINSILYLSILILILIIMSDVFDNLSKRITLIILILLIINNLELFAWYFGDYARLYLLLESSIAIGFIIPFVINSVKKDGIKNPNKTIGTYFNRATIFILILFIIAFIANIFGTLNLAIYILSFSAKFGSITIISYSFAKIFKNILQATLDVLYPKYPDLINNHGAKIIKKANSVINIIVVIAWGSGILQISEILTYMDAQFMEIFTAGISIGEFSFTFGSILLFVSIIYITLGLNKFIKNILEREVMVKKEMKRGSAAAISLTARILITFFGFTLALSATGIDMTRISIIAGALSVGIGFGLQNIVSNFVSGLILIYERPLQEGDTVEVGSLLGRVTNIGIRASNISTYDGAEVVVPNTNLVSNELINWTLSDKKKRQKVNIGVKYGTDPNLILKLLSEVCEEHPKILPSPAPLALFVGFGDSSLDFKVLFWVSFEDGLQTKSDINVAICNVLAEHNIEIPFPQVDLHVKDILGKEDESAEEAEIMAIEAKAIKKEKTATKEPKSAKALDLDGDGDGDGE
ncbi:MAG: hypothetical protein B6I18_05440 [Bacteroidetes bacterium 4572_112]|nr:MAG: hypothetical protein B6I18_05440 [Bacteroidetes bacterium 4572_112]